jgi:hypothetical protein
MMILFFVVLWTQGLVAVSGRPEYKEIIELQCSLQNLQSQLTPIDADEGLTVVMGLSGSGKSTLINFATRQPLQYVRNFPDYSISIERINSIEPPCGVVGMGFSSQTSVACVIQSYVDMPGFDDNRGPISEIRNNHIFDTLVQMDKPMRFIVCIPQYYLEPYQRAERLHILLSFLRPILVLNSPRVFEQYVSVVVTMATNTDPGVTKHHLARILHEAPHLSPEETQILSIWTKESFHHIMYLERPGEVKNVTSQDFHAIVAPSAPHIKHLRFGRHQSLTVCQFIRNTHHQLQKSVNGVFHDALLLLKSGVNGMILEAGTGRASDVRSLLKGHWLTLRAFLTPALLTDSDGLCCGDCEQSNKCGGGGAVSVGEFRYTAHKKKKSLQSSLQDLLTLFTQLAHTNSNATDTGTEAMHLFVALTGICRTCCALSWLAGRDESTEHERRDGCLSATSLGNLGLSGSEGFLAVVKYTQLLATDPISVITPLVPSATTTPDAMSLTLKGNIVGASDVMMAFISQQRDRSVLLPDMPIIAEVFARRWFLFDTDIALRGGSVSIYSLRCKVQGRRTAQLSGGLSSQPSCGSDGGGWGQPGLLGLKGGHFFCTCQEMHHCNRDLSDDTAGQLYTEKKSMVQGERHVHREEEREESGLQVIVTGGGGGKGCAGRKGRDGTSGVQGSAHVNPVTGRLSGAQQVGVREGIFARTFVFRSGVLGMAGGDGTMGGRGGQGGLPGSVMFEHFSSNESLEESGVRIVGGTGCKGVDGAGGRGGSGGVNLPVFEQLVYVTDKSLYNTALTGACAVIIGAIGYTFQLLLGCWDPCSVVSLVISSRALLLDNPMAVSLSPNPHSVSSVGATLLSWRRIFPLLTLAGVAVPTSLLALKVCILDRIATEDVQWTGLFAAPPPYEVSSDFYKAPDGSAGGCCVDWPEGEGAVGVVGASSEKKMGAVRRRSVVLLNDDILYDNDEGRDEVLLL